VSSLKKNIISGTLWSMSGQFSSLFMLLIANICLARILSPKEFGQIAIIMFFISVANIFVEGGLGGALIRKQNARFEDYSTVFFYNLSISVVCYFLLLIFSKHIADFYNDKELRELLIISGLVLIINALYFIPNAKTIKDLKFKQRSIYQFISTVLGVLIGIIGAYSGIGVWSIVCMQLTIAISQAILYWIYEKVDILLCFDRSSFKELYGFGLNTTLSSLINVAFDNIYQLIIGRFFSIIQVGLFYQAKKMQDVPTLIFNYLSQGVIFSSLSKMQDDKVRFSYIYTKLVTLYSSIIGFIMSSIFIYSKEMIVLFLGDKWVNSSFYLQVLCFSSFFYIQELLNRVIFKIFNQTKQLLFLEIIKKTIQTVTIAIGVIYLSMYILLIGYILSSFIGYLINCYYSRKIVNIENNSNIFLQIKVLSVSVISVLSYDLAIVFLNIEGYSVFLVFPFFLFVYILITQILRVVDVISELKSIILFNK
jgi:O-antigen/teichoic acid export membrane protein